MMHSLFVYWFKLSVPCFKMVFNLHMCPTLASPIWLLVHSCKNWVAPTRCKCAFYAIFTSCYEAEAKVYQLTFCIELVVEIARKLWNLNWFWILDDVEDSCYLETTSGSLVVRGTWRWRFDFNAFVHYEWIVFEYLEDLWAYYHQE